ncbi:MAG: hypothetical protein AAGH46_12800 [Bacteroidota bacterium]
MQFVKIIGLNCFCFVMFSCASLQTNDPQEISPYSAQGWGGTSCNQLINDITPINVGFDQAVQNIKAYQAWVSGFISGVNYASTDAYDISGATDPEESFIWLKEYCEQQPNAAVPEALHKLLEIWEKEGKIITEPQR